MSYALMSLILAVTALAVPGPDSPATQETAEHCVVFVVDVSVDGRLVTTEPECFASEEAAEAWGALGLPMADGLGLFSGEGVGPLSTFTLGRHYDGFNGTGSSISIVGSSCTGGYWNTTSSWRNRISSSYNGCARLRHYDYPNRAGQAQDTYGAGTTDNLSSLNNKAESISYHSS